METFGRKFWKKMMRQQRHIAKKIQIKSGGQK